MAWTDRYISADDYRRRNGRTDASDDVDLLEPLISESSRRVESETGRVFNLGDAQDVYVDGDDAGGADELLIPDMATITAIAVDTDGDGTFASSISPSAVWLQKLGNVRGMLTETPSASGFPYTTLVLIPHASNSFGTRWPRGRRNIRLTGQPGFLTVPEEVVEATAMFTRQQRDLHKSGMSQVLPSLDSGVQLTPGAFAAVMSKLARISRRPVVAAP